MKIIGIFEAKTHFPQLCTDVERSQVPVLVQRRGRPLVLITPVPPTHGNDRPDIVQALTEWNQAHEEAEADGDFPEVWKKRRNRKRHPMTEIP